jgi:hypothetical protein
VTLRPIAYQADGSITVGHDDLGHAGAIPFAQVRFGRDAGGGVDPDVLLLVCPVCGQTACHPIGGGAAPGPVQKLFLRTILRRAAALGIAADFATVKARVQARAEALDGVGRFRLGAFTSEDDDA